MNVLFSFSKQQIQMLTSKRTPGLQSVSWQVARPTMDSEEEGRESIVWGGGPYGRHKTASIPQEKMDKDTWHLWTNLRATVRNKFIRWDAKVMKLKAA